MTTQTDSSDQHPVIGLLFVICAAFAFSTKAIIIKVAYSYGAQVTPIMLMALRMLISLPFFIGTILILERRGNYPPLSRQDQLKLVALGGIGFYLAAFLDFLGLSYISASLERLILLLYPTLVVVFSAFFLGRQIKTNEIIALAVSYVGIVIVFYQELTMANSNIILGSALIFGSATAFAIYLMGSGEMIKRLGATRFTAYAMTLSCIVTLLHFGLDFDSAVIALPLDVYALAFLMAIVSTVIPAFLMSAGIHHIGAGPASIISATGPIMTIFLAYLILDEQLTYIQVLGAILVMVGVFIINEKKKV